MLKYMLDTNICIFTIKNRPEHVRTRFEANINRMAVSTITAMELLYGAEKSAKPTQNLAVIESFLFHLTVLDYNQQAAAQSGELRAELERQGQPIGAYDVMIAGHARAAGLIVVTNNTKEFKRVAGLRIEDWVNT